MMKKKLRDFNSECFRNWLSNLHDMDPNTKFCKKENDTSETYGYLTDTLLGKITIWKNNIVEEEIYDRQTNEQIFYLHYEMTDYCQVVDLVNSFKNRMFCVCQKEYVVSDDDTPRNILLCCSTALTTSMFASLLQDFSDEHHLPYRFRSASIFDVKSLMEDYDIVLVAPQVRKCTKEVASKCHHKFLNMDIVDYAEYNCNNIISRMQEAFI